MYKSIEFHLPHYENNSTVITLIKGFICVICAKTFTAKQHLILHIDSVHEGKKDFKCPHCGIGFGRPGHLKRHIQAVHEIGKSNF